MNKMNTKNILIISIAVSAILLTANLIFIQKTNTLNLQLKKTKQISKQMEEMLSRLQEEKSKLAKENEKLNADTVSYIGINTKLQEEKAGLQKDAEDLQKAIESKEATVAKARGDLKKLEKKIVRGSTKESSAISKEREELKKKMAEIEANLQKERGTYHYNLGVAYARARLYDEAVAEYKKSLKWDQGNPEANYNLALLYKDVKDDREEAVKHYRAYLKLKPDAGDKEEVEELIHNLK